jgi:hypothetical protein
VEGESPLFGRLLQLIHPWQLQEPELVKPGESFAERMQSRGADVSTFATWMDVEEELQEIIPEHVSKNHVCIVVQCPDSESNGSLCMYIVLMSRVQLQVPR